MDYYCIKECESFSWTKIINDYFIKELFDELKYEINDRNSKYKKMNELNLFKMSCQNLISKLNFIIHKSIKMKYLKDYKNLFYSLKNDNHFSDDDIDIKLLFDIFTVYAMDKHYNDGLVNYNDILNAFLVKMNETPNNINKHEKNIIKSAIDYYIKKYNNKPINLSRDKIINDSIWDIYEYIFSFSHVIERGKH